MLERFVAHLLPGQWGYAIVFLSALLESLPFGWFVPGQTILLLAGFATHRSPISLWGVIVGAAIGAFLGDLCSYWFGRRFGMRLLRRYGERFFIRKSHLKKTEKLMRSHPAKTLIIGRFISVSRAFSAFFAGVHKVRVGRFLFANAIGAILWGTTFAILGYLFGASYHLIERWLGAIFAAGIVLGAVLYLLYALLVRKRIISHGEFVLGAISAGAVVIFASILEDVIDMAEGGFWISFDTRVHEIFVGWHQIDPIARALSLLFSGPIATAATLLVVGWLWGKYRRRQAISFASIMILQALLVRFMKEVVGRIRPPDGLVVAGGSSFPSAHAATATVLCALILYISWKRLQGPSRTLALSAGIVIPLLVGLSRLALHVHWLSDVLGGWTLGIFLAGSGILLERALSRDRLAQPR